MTIRLIHLHQLVILNLSYGVKYQSGVIWGHWGQKVIFTKNVSTPFNYVALTHDLYICYNLTPLPNLLVYKITRGHLGSLGSKGHFHWKCYNLSMSHCMTIRLIHFHQLNTLYLYCGVKCQSGVIWGHRGQKIIFTKNNITRPWYIAWP